MNLPANFLNDIQGKDTSLIPLVVFTDLDIFISTNNLSVDGQYFQPILLNIPSIKQSVDIENRRFKISSVTLSISNYEYEGSRFSDLLQNTSMINKEVCVYWKSQTSTTLDTGEDTDCPKIYSGKVRRISHTTDTVTVELEDSTESNAHKDLPQEFLPSTSIVADKYKNKPIPMVYGHVDRSPCVLQLNDVIAEEKQIIGFNQIENNSVFTNQKEYPLYIYISDTYVSVPNNIEEVIDGSSFIQDIGENYSIEPQWGLVTGENNTIQLKRSGLFEASGLQVRGYYPPQKVEFINFSTDTFTSDDYINELEDEQHLLYDGDLTTFANLENIYSELSHGFGVLATFFHLKISTMPPFSVEATKRPEISLNSYRLPVLNDSETGIISDFTNVYLQDVEDYVDLSNLITLNEDDDSDIYYRGDVTAGSLSLGVRFERELNQPYTVKFLGDVAGAFPSLPNATIDAKFREILMTALSDIKEPLTKDFYANVKGRTSETLSESIMIGDDEVLLALENPAVIIRHILEEELGYTDFDEEDYQTALWEHRGLKYGFTVHDKQISSKKLIEDIAKSTLMFPHFGNDGKFRFNTMKRFYSMGQDDLQYQDQDVTDYESAFLMPVSDVIDYSFSKTKPEQIYSKYEVDYYYDYAQKSHLKKVSSDYSVTDTDYLDFYGFDAPDDNIGKLQSSYIRDEYTADWMNRLLHNHYKNQHLILKLKLPVKYIGLSVGDLVKFDELLGGITAYGRDYTKVELLPDTHQAYPLFYITSLQKNIDSVSVELMQLHDLIDGDTLDISYYEDADVPDRLFTQTQRDEIFRFSNFNGEESYTISQDSDISDTDFNDLFGMDKWYRQDSPFAQDADPISSFGDLVDVELNSGTSNLPIIKIQALDTTQNYEESVQSTIFVMANWNTTLNQIEYNLAISNGMEIIPEQTEIKIEILQPIESGITLRYDPPFGVQESIPWGDDEEDEVDDDNGVGLGAGSGDVTENGLVDILDLVSVVAFALGNHDYSQSQIDAADVNGDGVVNILDVVQMVNIVLEN